MNQAKLEVVKQEMARENIDSLRISERKWTEWENLIQMTILSTSVGKNPTEETEQPSKSTKVSEMQFFMQSQKGQNDLCSFPRQTIQYHSNPRLCPNQ